ncbi:hypothetical protein O1L55_36275 [Streptomyces albulus]|nr:hypothetical protein [Streptomyces noursei]
MRALIDWSHELCTGRERLLWARASVFRGGFDLESLERVCTDAELPPGALLDTLDALVTRSIVNCRQEKGRSRYHMLETVREYGHERLAASGSLDALRGRHRDRYAELTARAGREWFGPRQVEWFTRLRLEHPNLRAALEFCLERPGQARAGLALAVSPRHYWITAGLLSEGRRWLSQLLAADDPKDDGEDAAGPDPAVRVHALVTETYLGILQGDPDADVQRALAGCEAAARRGGHRRSRPGCGTTRGSSPCGARTSRAPPSCSRGRAPSSARRTAWTRPSNAGSSSPSRTPTEVRSPRPTRHAARSRRLPARTTSPGCTAWLCSPAPCWPGGRARPPTRSRMPGRPSPGCARSRTGGAWPCVEVIAWSTQDAPRRAARLLGVLHLLWESLGGRLGSVPFMRAQHLRFEAAVREALSAAAFERICRGRAPPWTRRWPTYWTTRPGWCRG